MKNKLKNINIKLIIITIIHFLITFITDRNIFFFTNINIANYVFCKIILILVLYLFWSFIFKLIKKDKNTISYFKKFLIYMIPITILLVLCWPGNWFGPDVANFYEYAIHGNYLYYLNYLSSVFYIIGLMLFPVPSGAIILLTIFFGIIFSYLTKNLYDIYKSKLVYLILIPFFMLNTLFYTFFANRPIIFGIAYLLLISIILLDKIKKKNLTTKKLIVLMLLTGIVGYFRSESIYLVLAIPLFIFIVYKIKVNFKNIIKIFGFSILAFLIVASPQKLYEYKTKTDRPSSRNLPMYVGPLSYMLTMNLKGDNLERDLKKIDKVIGIEEMKEYPSYIDTFCVWNNNCIKTTYTKKEYQEFQKAYFNVIKNNIPEFLLTKTLTFANASCIYGNTFSTKNLYDEKNNMLFNRKDTKPFINYKIRKFTYSFLEGRFDDKWQPNLLYRIFNNLFVAFLIIGIIFIYSIIKKKLFYFLLSGMLIGHSVIVFFTAPASYFMYYFNVYITSLVIGVIFLIDYIYYKKYKKSYVLEKDNKKITKTESKLKKLLIQAFKFFGISGIGWLIDFTSYTIMTSILKIDIMIANIISSFLGITFVYLVSTRKLFQNNSKYNLKVKYIAYILYQVIFVLLVSYLMTFLKKYLLGFDIKLVSDYVNIITKIVVTPFTMVINFIVMKNLIERI